MADTIFEIPQTLRDVSEQNLKLAHDAYDRLIDFVMRAMDAWMEAMTSYPATAGFKEVQGRAAHVAKDNADSAFTGNAPISPETLTLQMHFARDWMRIFTAQTQEIYTLIQEGLQKAEPGAFDKSMDTRFKQIQECAAEMSTKNAESAFALVEKIGKAQNIQDILTLQAQFARKQMEAYVVQAQGLRRLINQLQQAKSPTSAAA